MPSERLCQHEAAHIVALSVLSPRGMVHLLVHDNDSATSMWVAPDTKQTIRQEAITLYAGYARNVAQGVDIPTASSMARTDFHGIDNLRLTSKEMQDIARQTNELLNAFDALVSNIASQIASGETRFTLMDIARNMLRRR